MAKGHIADPLDSIDELLNVAGGAFIDVVIDHDAFIPFCLDSIDTLGDPFGVIPAVVIVRLNIPFYDLKSESSTTALTLASYSPVGGRNHFL